MNAALLLGWGLGPPESWGGVTSRQPPCRPDKESPTTSWLGGTNTACLGMSTSTPYIPSWLGGLTYKLLTSTTLIYAYGAGITMAAGTRLGGSSTACLGKSACTPSWLEGNNTTCLGMSTCTACTPPGLRGSAWEGVMVLKELIFNSFYFGWVWWSWKNWFLTIPTLGGCGGLERTESTDCF